MGNELFSINCHLDSNREEFLIESLSSSFPSCWTKALGNFFEMNNDMQSILIMDAFISHSMKLEIKKVTRIKLAKVYNWEIHDGIKKQKSEIINFVRLFQFYGK